MSLAEDLWVALATRWGEGLFTAQRDNLKKRWDLARGGPPGPALQWLQTRHQVRGVFFWEAIDRNFAEVRQILEGSFSVVSNPIFVGAPQTPAYRRN